jgi:hypothetical protein
MWMKLIFCPKIATPPFCLNTIPLKIQHPFRNSILWTIFIFLRICREMYTGNELWDMKLGVWIWIGQRSAGRQMDGLDLFKVANLGARLPPAYRMGGGGVVMKYS